MTVKYAYLYCLSHVTIDNLLKIGIVNVPPHDKRALGELLKPIILDTWNFEMAKFIQFPRATGQKLQTVLELHYPVVERNIFSMPLEDAYCYFDLMLGESCQLTHNRRT
jgi:hypothetical protein